MSEPINKEQLRERILELEGLTEEEKLQLVRLLDKDKKYGLVWEDKPEEIEEQMREQLPVLTEVKERALTDGGEQAPNHVLIEGDNLAALTALSYTHEGKIDVIYIDPPYNTGNKDFVYNDSFVDTEDSYRHSKWLSFMEKRLRIAKRLLSDKGVIFISIDDNEQANLKLLCDEVFSETNAIGPIIQNKLNAKNDTINIQKNHEYILCYRKQVILNGTKVAPNIELKKQTEKEVFIEGEEYYYLNDSITTRGEGGTLNARPNLGYTFYYNPKTNDIQPVQDYDIELAKTSNEISKIYSDRADLVSEGYIAIRPPQVRGQLGCWTWDINKAIQDSRSLLVKGTKNRYNVIKRTFVSTEDVIARNGKFYFIQKESSNSKSILEYSTNDGSKLLTSILGANAGFNNPKNMEMIQYLISISSNKFSIILDFFAGSGTTLHATMQLNAEDGGHRQCILVTNNENNICEEVTYERNKRVIQGYTTPKGVAVEGLKNNNLRYYKMEFLPREMTFDSKQALMRACVDLLCIKENIYTEVREFCGMKFKPSLLRYFNDHGRQMLFIFDERVIEHIVPMIAKMDGKMKVYVFSNGAYAYEDEFLAVKDKVELCALPEAILQAYHKVLPRRQEEVRI